MRSRASTTSRRRSRKIISWWSTCRGAATRTSPASRPIWSYTADDKLGRACQEPFVINFDRQKITGWILVVVSTAFILYFLKVRLFGTGPVLEKKEWVQFIISIVVLMIGTMNVRLAALRAARRKGRSE